MTRFSRLSDTAQITQLVSTCFGKRLDKEKYLDDLEGRYLVFIDNGEIIAMTGLKTRKEGGMEVDWTCTHPEYRHRGIMHQLFERLLEMTDEDIYCSCWKLSSKTESELHSLMENFEFECILEGHINHVPAKCGFNDLSCPHYSDGCSCREDLYVRRGFV